MCVWIQQPRDIISCSPVDCLQGWGNSERYHRQYPISVVYDNGGYDDDDNDADESAAPACMRRDAVGARNSICDDPVQCAQEAPLLVLPPKAAELHRLLPVHHRIGFAAAASH